MQKLKSKTMAIMIAAILTISMGTSMMFIPNAKAATTTIPTFAFIHVAPNPIGANQTVTIYIWLNQLIAGGYTANDIRFHNYELTITAPDGTITTQTFPVDTDPDSSQYTTYTPTQIGTYSLNFTFPGQTYNFNETLPGYYGAPPSSSAIYIGDYYEPSNASTTLTVQSTPIASGTGSSPLPTDYWTRPIYGENNYDYLIASNWLGTGSAADSSVSAGAITAFPFSSGLNRYPGNAVGSLTSHIMWTKPLEEGGVVGGSGGSLAVAGDTYFEGSAYDQRYDNPIIIDAYLYYTEPVSFTGTQSGPTDCVDLQTGALVWSSTKIPALSFGYIYDVQEQNQHGVYPAFLISSAGGGFFGPPSPTTWTVWDAFTGDYLFNMTNIPSGTVSSGVNGEQLQYVLSNDGTPTQPQYYLAQWNFTHIWDNAVVGNILSGGSTSPTSFLGTVDASIPSMYDWNISIPSLDTMTSPSISILAAMYGNVALGKAGSYPATGASSSPYTYFAINLNSTVDPIGTILWTNPVSPPTANVTITFGGVDPTVGVFVEGYKETMQWVGYSLTTGKQIWGPVGNQSAFDYYGQPYFAYCPCQLAYGNLYSVSFGGILYCYDLTHGDLLWTYGNGGEGNSTNSGFNTGYGDYPTQINAVGNGVVYTVTTEHTVSTPLYKGALTRAINATDGKEIWTLSDYTGEFSSMSYAMADGYNNWFNGYDDQIYTVGRGPSATTVTAPNVGLSFGQSVVISGSVTDISAGTKQTEQAADFPNGVPCASDASMSAWMSYVYQQQSFPTNFTGVPVQISVLDSNGNYRSIGATTTDASGTYSLSWTPNISGNYTVVASFAGTKGYWPSSAETYFNVMKEPTSTSAPTATPTSVADMYFVPAIAGLFVLIIIVLAVVVLLMLRKRP